jgi:hypothetical protein
MNTWSPLFQNPVIGDHRVTIDRKVFKKLKLKVGMWLEIQIRVIPDPTLPDDTPVQPPVEEPPEPAHKNRRPEVLFETECEDIPQGGQPDPQPKDQAPHKDAPRDDPEDPRIQEALAPLHPEERAPEGISGRGKADSIELHRRNST